MISRRITVAITAMVALAGITVAIYALNGSTSSHNAAQNGTVVVRISAAELNRRVRVLQMVDEGENIKCSNYRATVLNQVVGDQILYEKAKELGLAVSKQKAEQYASSTFSRMAALPDSNPSKILLTRIAQEFGYNSIAAYGASQVAIDEYQRALSIGNLRERVMDSAPTPSDAEIQAYISKSKTPISRKDAIGQLQQRVWDNFETKLIDGTKCKIITPSK